ncbi:MAG: cysteine desulfurase family protein, partial [Myxococcota bacterium]
EVLETMREILERSFGNPSSTHAEGAAGKATVDSAREQVAALLGVRQAPSDSIFFTAGATEANNALLRFGNWVERGRHVVSTGTEHPSVLEPLEELETSGQRVTRVAVDADGMLDPERIEDAIEDDTGLVSVIWANNETGVIQPMAEIAEVAKARGVWLHADATQALGKASVDVEEVPVDFLSVSAHKLNGPKGAGCLYARHAQALRPWLSGGGQESGLRGGTENVAGIAGFGAACALAQKELPERMSRYAELRDRLWRGMNESVLDLRLNGSPGNVLVNTLNVEFCGAAGEVILQALDLEGVAVSAGAACHSGAISPSHVLTAMGRTPDEARGCLRFSVGYGVDEAQVDRAVEILASVVPRAREAGAQ